ncbi:AMP-binding protein [Rhodocytophaga aerolata]|uniref:AMP-binding protein n=1 Tax=Rhodocytophaga aerolata TaxID=455078 RepID=A0ABT8R1R9_9BACT|nr:AMP-binding protein [Rhodocytophaga aerolata]MDO1445329.1 AMP-binding protein [Rhodocytophaga aerolata]
MPTQLSDVLHIGNYTLSYDAIRQGRFPGALSAYETQTLLFCQQWLSGQETFTLFTSGSTGTPKSITFHRQQMIASAHMTGKALGLVAGDRALVSLPTQYIGGQMMLVRGFELQLHLTILPPSSMPLSAFTEDTHFDFLSFVPLQLQNSLAQTPEKIAILHRAKAILLGGAPVSQSLEAQLQAIQAPIYHTYGMTETISHIALKKLTTSGKQPYFTVLEGIKISLDGRGCLVIRAPFLNDEPVVTNDVVQLLSPSTFEWMGRIDHVINSGGVKVQAEKVEQGVEKVLLKLNLHKRFFVAPLPDALLGEKVTLFIEGSPLSTSEEKSLTDELSIFLTHYEKPKSIRYVPAFSQTASGKLDKRQSMASIAV